jgi:hypothetical protein
MKKTIDVIQKYGKVLKEPEIRVWCHPHYIGRRGSDYYRVFENITKAFNYARNTKSAEKNIFLAVNGYEYSLIGE